MAFQSTYDEDLSQNKFFQKLQSDHKILIDTAPLENWIICVPRSATIKSDNLTDTDYLLAHILIPHDEVSEHYTNLLGADVKQINGKLHTHNISSTILFEEIFYTKGLAKYKVWCIELSLLRQDSDIIDADETPAGIFIVRGLTDAVALIWNETNSKAIFRKIENICCSFMKNTNCTSNLMLNAERSYDAAVISRENDIKRIRNSVEILLSHCFKKLMYQKRLHEKCARDQHFRRVFKIALETYIMDILYRWIFDSISLCYAKESEKLNKVVRNLSDTNLKHFKIDSKYNDIIGRVRTELLKISDFTTPIEKISKLFLLYFFCTHFDIAENFQTNRYFYLFIVCSIEGCLRRSITAASQCKHNDISVDDLIPILVFVIIKSGLTHWIPTLNFLKNFIFTEFSVGSDKGIDSFLITTLEAAIMYIESIDLNDFRLSFSLAEFNEKIIYKECETHKFATVEQFIEFLFRKILVEDELEIIKLLKTDKNLEIAIGDSDDDADTDADVKVKSHDNILMKSINVNDNNVDDDDDIDEGVSDEVHVISKFPLCRLNLQNRHGIGSIHIAAMHGLPKMLNLLLALGVNLKVRDENNYSPLHYAASRGHQNTLLLLLHAGAEINALTNDKNTALHLSCLNGHTNCVKALLYYSDHMKVKIDRNFQNKMGDTAIHMAAKWGFSAIVETLLEYGVKMDLVNRLGHRPIDYAHNSRIASLLQNAFVVIDSADNGSAWRAVSESTTSLASNQQDLFHGCFSSSIAPVIDENNGDTFIHRTNNDKIVSAIRNGDTVLAYHFLGIELPDEITKTVCHPLCDCEKCKHISAELFQQRSANQLRQTYEGDINECSADGVNPLHAAIQQQNIELIEHILKLGAKIDCQSERTKKTAINYAVQTKCPKILDLILSNIVDDTNSINIPDSNGNTPLHNVIESGNVQLIECLLKYEPNNHLKNNKGKTAMDIAKSSFHLNVVRLLELADNSQKIESKMTFISDK